MTSLMDTTDGERQFAADLSAFLEDGLAAHGLELRSLKDGDRGVFAVRALPNGYALACPQRFVLDGRSASRTGLGAALQAAATQIARGSDDGDATGGGGGGGGGGGAVSAAGVDSRSGSFSDEELMLAVLADAHPHRSTGAPFAPYAALLPAEAPGALSWPAGPKGRGLLFGTDLGAALEHAESDLVGLQLRLSAVALSSAFHYRGGEGGSGGGGWPPPSKDDLRWAQGMLLSRRFPLVGREARVSGGGGAFGCEGALIPLLDFLNHRADAVVLLSVATAADAAASAGTSFKVIVGRGIVGGGGGGGGGGDRDDDEGGVVVLRNTAPVATNEQVWNNYGTDKSNEELVAMYGFAIPDNPSDAVAFLVQQGGEQGCEAAGAEGLRFLVGRAGLTEELWQGLVSAVRGGKGKDGGDEASGAMGDDDDDDDDDEEEEERIEEAALGLLRSALESKLAAALSAGGGGGDGSSSGGGGWGSTATETAAAAASGGGQVPSAAAASRAAHRAKSAGEYRKGVVEVLRGAVAECTAMAAC